MNAALDTRKDTHRSLLDERADLRNQLAACHGQRSEGLKGIAPESLELYRQLRPKKHNQPMAIMRGESCTVCGVEQTMAITREAQIGQSLVTCLS